VYRADRWVAFALVALGAVAWILTASFPASTSAVGPASLPRGIAAILMLLGALLGLKAHQVVRAGSARSIEWRPGFRPRVAAALLSIVLFITLLERVPALGFPLLAPPLLVALGRIFGGRSWPILIGTSIAVAEGAYFFFHGWLGLVLPASAWF
jgi:Tripartite tricarboxylate transporter TctB family